MPIKQPSKPTAKRSVKPSAKPSARPSEPFLRFYHSDDLRVKTLAVLTTLEEASNATQHRGALADLVVELTESGMEYYFLRPLKLAKVGFVVEHSAHLGIAGALRVQASITRTIIGRMDESQLLTVCGHIRHLME